MVAQRWDRELWLPTRWRSRSARRSGRAGGEIGVVAVQCLTGDVPGSMGSRRPVVLIARPRRHHVQPHKEARRRKDTAAFLVGTATVCVSHRPDAQGLYAEHGPPPGAYAARLSPPPRGSCSNATSRCGASVHQVDTSSAWWRVPRAVPAGAHAADQRPDRRGDDVSLRRRPPPGNATPGDQLRPRRPSSPPRAKRAPRLSGAVGRDGSRSPALLCPHMDRRAVRPDGRAERNCECVGDRRLFTRRVARRARGLAPAVLTTSRRTFP